MTGHFAFLQVKSAQDAMLGFGGSVGGGGGGVGFNFGSSQIGGFPLSYSSRRSSSSGGSGSPTSPPSPPHPMLAGPTSLRVLPNNRYYSMQYDNGAGGRNGSRTGYTSPQEYLNNPMFDSLQNRHRLYWPINDRTITLKPLTSLKSGKGLQHKMMQRTGKNSCKVL